MLVRRQQTTLLQIFCKTVPHSEVIVKSIIDPDCNFSKNSLSIKRLSFWHLNSCMIRLTILALTHSHSESPLESIVCYTHTCENKLVIKQNFTKYLKESCCLAYDQYFFFKCFPENVFVSKILQKSSGLFRPG